MARKKKEETVEIVKNAPKKKVEEITEKPVDNDLYVNVIYHKGDNIEEIAKALTGHAYMIYRVVEANGYSMNDIPDGAILKWKV